MCKLIVNEIVFLFLFKKNKTGRKIAIRLILKHLGSRVCTKKIKNTFFF